MKKYISSSLKWLALLSIISIVALIVGIICFFTQLLVVGIGLTMFGIMMGSLFLILFLIEINDYVIIDDEKIILPRSAKNNKKMSFHKTTIYFNEIHSIKSDLIKGDGIIAKDTFFHTIKLKDGTTIRSTLYGYGKGTEKEILESIKGHIRR